MNNKNILALAAAAVIMFPIYGCTPAANRESGFAGNAPLGTTNQTNVNTASGYHARPDIANVLTRKIPGVRTAAVFVKGHSAYVAVNRGVLGGTAGTTGGYTGGNTGGTAGTYGFGTAGGGSLTGPGMYGGATTNGVAPRYTPGDTTAGYTGGVTPRYAPGYPGGATGGMAGPRIGTGGYTAGDNGTVTGGTTGINGVGGTTGAGGVGGTTGIGGAMGGTTGGNMGTTGGTTGRSGLTADLRQRIVNTVKASDHDLKSVYVSDDPSLLSSFQGFAGRAAGATRTGINDIGNTIRRFFPGVRP